MGRENKEKWTVNFRAVHFSLFTSLKSRRVEELWNEISQKIFDDNKNHERTFYEEKDLFYQRLFVIDSDSLKNFNEIYKTFEKCGGIALQVDFQ